MSDKDGGPAFPRSPHSGEPSDDGMRLRDYFAAKALPIAADMAKEIPTSEMPKGKKASEGIAAFAYYLADAMLKERARDR